MVTAVPGGTVVLKREQIPSITDPASTNNKVLNFKEDKDKDSTNAQRGILTAKGRDGSEYFLTPQSDMFELTVAPKIDTKELRKRMPGIPLPKAEAKKLDDEIKKEQEEADKAAEEGQESPEVESMKKRSVAPEEAPKEKETTAFGRKAR
jgi:hypothetical protein